MSRPDQKGDNAADTDYAEGTNVCLGHHEANA